jgi:hypothetical protein
MILIVVRHLIRPEYVNGLGEPTSVHLAAASRLALD